MLLGKTICHVNLARGFRGGERQTELLIRALAERGVPQRFVGRRTAPLIERLADVAGLELRACANNALAAARCARGADLVHAHEARAAHAGYLLRRFGGAPYLITRRVDNRPKPARFSRAVFRGAARVVALSNAVRDVMQAYEPRLGCVLIPSASSGLVPREECVRELRARYSGKLLVGHVGELHHDHKGQGVLIEAARGLARTHPELHFLLLGEGRDEARLRAAAGDLANLEFVGRIEAVGDYLAAFDAFVFPSLREGLGSILLDAMEFGLPIVAARAGGIPDIVHDGENGLLVAPGSAVELGRALGRLAEDRALRERLGARGAELAVQYTPDAMAKRYLALYGDILSA